jgi:hypothetical protein
MVSNRVVFISPILICVYLDGLILKLFSDAKIGCFVGTTFVGVLAYADDLVLLAPTAGAMRHMLSICERYAMEYAIVFNAKKSKCLLCGNNKYDAANARFALAAVR